MDLSYFTELAADIAAKGGVDLNDQEAVRNALIAAHGRRQAFAQEMLENRTERAQMARKVLAAQIYGEAVKRGAQERAIEHCGHIANTRMRKAVWG